MPIVRFRTQILWGMTNQLNDLRSYSRHWLGEFIELYQAEECLWQPKHPDYSNNSARNNAYDKLVLKLKEVEPEPDRSMVVRKINSLRSAFRRELRKINGRPNYETRLWYYDKLAFIADHGNPKRLIANTVPELKPQKRSISLGFDEDDSMEFEDEQQIEPNSAHSAAQAELQNETATATITAIANGDVVTIVKSENHKTEQDGHQQNLSQAQNAHETATLHHHHHQQQQHHHAQHLHTQTQPQHTTAVKVLEITSLDSNSQREIQQAVNSLEQQHQMQQLQQQQQQQQQQQNANQSAAAQLAAQIQQQVPTIQIAREHLQPLFGGTATTYTTTTAPVTTQRPNDEYDGIGINVASKLRIMSAHQRIIAEKLINDVLFNAQLDNLSVNSHLAQ
uniref:MADF domain-containing protein n=1 Tax=Glossina brevipalpis TaxID=37001 RepID=A0A1A9W1Q1_9MUSC